MIPSSAETSLHMEQGSEDDIDALNASNLPEFMRWESPGNWAWGEIYDLYPDLQFVLRSGDEIVAAMNLVPACRQGREPALAGYDDVVVRAVGATTRAADCLSLLSIPIASAVRRQGMAEALIRHSKRLAAQRSFHSVIGPLRPTRKHLYPLIPITEYAAWRREDGSAFDPWLRLHLTMGAEIVGTAPRSLVIEQPVARWEQTTQVSMPVNGEYVVPRALVPVTVVDGTGTYAEPNIWISHTVTEEQR